MSPIEMLSPVAAEDGELVGSLADLINRVYAVAEKGLWIDGAARTSVLQLAELIAAGEIAVARRRGDGRIIGTIRVHELDARLGGFGILVADPDHRGEGVGRDLIRFAEDHGRRRGHTVMQLELLVPRDGTHPAKVVLDAWYTRIGYRPVRSGPMDEAYPQLAPLLATACNVVTYHKPLV